LTVGQIVVAALVVIAVGAMVFLFVNNPEVFETQAKEPLMLIAGALIAGFTTVINWFFGSSKGSSDKSAMLYKAMNK